MKITTIEIKPKQMMVDIIPVMQTNTIYNKSIPGIGATTLEIDTVRNSILILPFVPVIEGKEHKEDGTLRKDILGVYGKVNQVDISNYLETRGNKTKKILCTPEKFDIVMKAIIDQGDDPYKSYFLLIDECETMIKDIDFRFKIKLPMKDFFKFENKAMVSATPIIPRDSRFVKHDFTYVKITPSKNRKYKVNLDLIGTNNVISVLREYIQNHENETLCIFTNCSKTITKIISDLNIQKDAKVFCSDRLIIKRFKPTGITHAYTSLGNNKGGLAHINFFTGRFFSAVDMIFPDIKPHIIMVTNIYHSNHSKIDPATDAIQISGRFRKGIKKMVHISNYNPDIPLKTKLDLRKESNELITIYKYLNLFKKQQGASENRISLINQIFDEPPFIKMMTDGKLDTYLADNMLQNQYVDSYYSNHLRLLEAYNKTNYFKIKPSFKPRKVSDEDIMRKDEVTGAKRREQIAKMLDKYVKENGPFNLDISYYSDLQDFYSMDEVIYSAYFDLGMDFMQTAKYQLRALKRGLLNYHKEKLKVSDIITQAVYIDLNRHQTVTNKEAKDVLQIIYNLYSDKPITATGEDIKLYFETTESHSIIRDGKPNRGYKLGELKYPTTSLLTSPKSHLNTL